MNFLHANKFFRSILFLCLVVSCQSSTEPKKNPIKEPPPPPTTTQPPAQNWEESLGKVFETANLIVSEKKISDEKLFITLKNTEPLLEDKIASILKESGLTLAPLNPPFSSIEISAQGQNNTIIKGIIYLNDIRAFLKKSISEPELMRRLQITTIETLESVKAEALDLRKNGDLLQAQTAIEKWLALEPQSEQALGLYGNILRDQKKYWDAVQAYKKIVEINPTSLFAYHNLGYCYDKAGTFEESEAAYTKAIELEPKNRILYQQLAEVLRKDTKWDAAIETISMAKTLGETSELLLVEGNIYRDKKDFAKAMDAYNKALLLNPADNRPLFNQILVLLDQKKWADAKKKFLELQNKDPSLIVLLKDVEIFNENEE